MKRALMLAMVALIWGGCSAGGDTGGSEENGNAVEVLPECGTVCVGRYVRSCSEDQKHYIYEHCGDYGMCKDGSCTSAVCVDPGKAECDPAQPGVYELCLENLSQLTTKSCSDTEACIAGACAPSVCEADEKQCGWKTVLTCTADSNWETTECGETQYCDDLASVCLDMDSLCIETPGARKCQDLSVALECNHKGKLKPIDCGKDEVCVEGFCQPRVEGVSYGESGEGDVIEPGDSGGFEILEDIVLPEIKDTGPIDIPPKDIPPLEVPPKAWVTINGGNFESEQIKFTNTKQGVYIFKDTDLQVSMAKGMYLLEVHFGGIEEGVVGSFSSDEPGSVTPWIWFNDGTTDQNEVQWKYESVTYQVTMDQFDQPGGRVIGTFSGTLEDVTGGPPIELTDGFFDVPRKQ